MEMIAEFLEDLARRNVELWLEGDSIRWRGPKGALKEDDCALLTSKKVEVAHLLKQRGLKQIATFPLAYSQRALWYINQSAPDSAAYNVAFSARICSEFNMEAFGQAVQTLVDRHASLRTTYAIVQGEPVQQIHAYMECRVQIKDASGFADDELKNLVVSAHREPFDLEKGPILRVHIFVRNEKEGILLLSAHHIGCDGWSLVILLEELRGLYAAIRLETDALLPRPKSEFVRYAEWQRRLLKEDVGEKLFVYWRDQLKSNLPILNLPTDYPRPPIQTYKGSAHTFTIDARLTEKLKSFARQQESTLFTVLLAAFYVLLHRYTGQEDILVGTPTYGRSRAEFSTIVGDLINTVTVRGDLSGNPIFTAFLAQIRHVALEALEHQDYPFPLIVERLRLARDPSRSPIYQSLFIFQKFGLAPDLENFLTSSNAGRMDFGGIELESFFIPQQEGQLELVLEIGESGRQLFGNFKYNTDLFDARTIERMVGHFAVLLDSVVSDPSRRISELTILTEEERHQILMEWNATESAYPANKTLVQLFEEQVERSPEGEAVTCAGISLTYGDLNHRANQVAQRLRAFGVRAGEIVGIYLDRSIDMVVGLLGILKAGGAYTPLDPHFPADRIEFMLVDSHSGILITQSHLRGNISGFPGKVIFLDSDWEANSIEQDSNLAVQTGPNDLAYVIYTSGSTGNPKGVQISHRALVNFLCSMQREPGMTAADSFLSVTTMSFDIFGLELFLPLITGARVVIAERDDTLDGSRLTELLKKHGVTVMQATPSTWRLLIESGWSGHEGLKVLCGGEAFPSDLVGALLERCKELWNLYGPTETTIWSTVYRIASKEAPILIGHPIANTQVYILDNTLQLVPTGVLGELHIGGDGLSRGYLNRPELTAEKFIPHPFSQDPGARIYKTGDLARYRPDGTIECLGRMDHQVKLRGFRIELGEIEARMKEVEGVGNCVVVLREDRPGDHRLVAYYVGREGGTVTVSDMRSYLRLKLADYMVPQHFMELPSIPLTPNGKVDRKSLPKPEADGALEQGYVAPRSDTEEKVAAIWQEVLNRGKVGVHDNFFELGGHSLLATQVMSRITCLFGIQLPLKSLFETKTLGILANLIDTILWSSEIHHTIQSLDTEERETIEI